MDRRTFLAATPSAMMLAQQAPPPAAPKKAKVTSSVMLWTLKGTFEEKMEAAAKAGLQSVEFVGEHLGIERGAAHGRDVGEGELCQRHGELSDVDAVGRGLDPECLDRRSDEELPGRGLDGLGQPIEGLLVVGAGAGVQHPERHEATIAAVIVGPFDEGVGVELLMMTALEGSVARHRARQDVAHRLVLHAHADHVVALPHALIVAR